MPEHFVELLLRATENQLAAFEAWLEGPRQGGNYFSVELVAVVEHYTMTASTCLRSINDHTLVTATSNTKSMSSYRIIGKLGLLDHFLRIVNRAISEQKYSLLYMLHR